ncbi:WD domain, G-beta repeat protein (macronuclear) [Tetrahymena thermophila SB210]|uniref:WD domain, G-beta repeat protein n=1 Tax=Tetrahymena thermophila (strain SB210) TaxID=312017 RepID=W7WZH1_TETTS|nr:WD domain, G-beta repeat protein [Tetrahymena thermophila SB210]EWS71002.1 WD domain, G-beta repeat protein [Tetrahymena thermophila SB210]|eukprot:XP_012656465.1 WD domain, G-beta repeat protein [Tetrahymena thermophila SB210]
MPNLLLIITQINLISILLNTSIAQQSNSCSFGCIQCQTSPITPLQPQCTLCDDGFTMNNNQCQFQNCPSKTYLQRYSVQQNGQYQNLDSCQAICDFSYNENTAQNTCDQLQKCSVSYLSNQSIVSLGNIQSIYQINEKLTMIVYPNFLRLINAISGQYLSDIQEASTINALYFQNLLFILSNSNQVIRWDFDFNFKTTIAQIQQGNLSKKSQLFDLSNGVFAISSYDDISKIIYFTKISLVNQLIASDDLIPAFTYTNCSLKLVSSLILCFGQENKLITKRLTAIQQQLVIQDIPQNDNCKSFIFVQNTILQSIFLDFTETSEIIIIQQQVQQLIQLSYNKISQSFDCKFTNLIDQPNKIRLVDLQNKNYILAINLNSQLIFLDQNMKQIHAISFPLNQVTDIAFTKDQNSQFMTYYKLYVIQDQIQQVQIYKINLATQFTGSINTLPILVGKATQFLTQQSKTLFSDETNTILDKSSLFLVNSNLQAINIEIDEIQYIVIPFNQKNISHTNKISSMAYSDDSLYLLTCSDDGYIMAWYTLTSLNPSFLYMIKQNDEYCRNILIHQNKWAVALFSRSIIIFQIRNQYILYTYPFINPPSDLSQFIAQSSIYIFLFYDSKFVLIDGNNINQITIANYLESQIVQIFPVSDTKLIIQNINNHLQLYQFDESQQYLFKQVQNMYYQSTYGSFTYVQIDMISANDFEIMVGCLNNAFIILNSQFQPQLIHIMQNGYPFEIQKFSDNNIYIIFGFNANAAPKYFHYAVFRSSNKSILYSKSFNLLFNLGLHEFIDYQKNTNVQYLCTLPVSTLTIILRGVFFPQYLTVSYYYFTYAFGKPVSSYQTKDNGNIQYYGNQDGNLSYDSVDYIIYNKLKFNPSVIPGSVSSVQSSPSLELIFVVHYQVDLYSIYTYQYESQITFNSQYDTEKVIQLLYSDKNKIVIAYKSKQLILKNLQTKQSLSLNQIQQISGVYIDENDKIFYLYGSTLRIYNFDLSQIVEVTKEGSKSYQQCIITMNLIICKSNFNSLSIYNKKTYSQIANILIINQDVSFKIFVDEANSLIFLCTTFVQIFNFIGNQISQIQSINYNIIDLQFWGNNIAILTQYIIFFYQRQTLTLISNIRPFGGGNILGYYYISDFNTVAFYTDELRYGQIFYYNLNTYQDDGFSISSYTELGLGYVVDLFYDSYNSRLNYLDSVGLFYSVTFIGQRMYKNVMKFLEFSSLGVPAKMLIEHTNNNLFIYNSNIILYCNFNDNQKSTVSQSAKSVQFFFKYQAPSSNESSQILYYVFDNNNILYLYKDFNQIYLTYFTETVRDIKQIDEYQIVTLIFDQKILIYSQEQISKQKISSSNYIAVINDHKIRRFLTNSLILTYDYRIIHINYLFYIDGTKNWIKYATDYSQNKEYFRNYITYDLITKQKTIYSLGSGRLMLYDESTQILKQVLPAWQSQQNVEINYVKYFSLTSNSIVLGYQKNFITIISRSDFSIIKQQDVSALTQQILSELSVLFVDEQNNRVFASYMYQKLIYVLDLQSLSFLKYLNFPNNQYNRIAINNNLIFLYSNSQVNIHERVSLQYINFIKKNNQLNQILNFLIVDENKIILPMNTQIEIYLIDKQSSVSIIDSSLYLNSEIMSTYMQPNESNILKIIGVSKNGIFEKRINIMVISQQNSYSTTSNQQRYSCYSQISMINRIDGLKQFYLSYNQNTQNMDYRILTTFGDEIKQIEFIQDPKIKVVVAPDIQNLNQTLKLYQNTFQTIQRAQVYFQNFSFIFTNNNQLYLFSNSTQSVKWQNIVIKDQILQNNQILFRNLSDVSITNLTVENVIFNQNYNESDQLSNWNETLILFTDCNNIYLNNLTIQNTQLWQRSLLFGFLRVNQIQINNLTIINSNFYQIMAFLNGKSININQINMVNNTNSLRLPYGAAAQKSYDYLQDGSEKFAISIVGYQSTLLQGIKFIQNQNILFLKYTNSFKSEREQITLFDDTIQISNFIMLQTKTSLDNSIITSKQLSQALISIQSTQISFINLNYRQNQGNILIQNSDEIKIQNSVFQNNTSLDGGALQFINANQIVINNCSLNYNIANGSGGAIFLREAKKFIIDNKSNVSFNFAEIGGGVRVISSQFDPKQTIINEARISQNTALIYGKDIGIFPFKIILNLQHQKLRKLQLEENQKGKKNLVFKNKYFEKIISDRILGEENLFIESFRSGNFLPLDIQFVDQYDQLVQFSVQKLKDELYPSSVQQELNSFQIEITADSLIDSQAIGQTFVNYNQYNEDQKTFKFTSLQINADPLSFQSFLIKAITNSFLKSAQINLKLNIQFRQCQRGEIYKIINQNIQICEVCQSGFYSLIDPQQSKNQTLTCIKCPAQATSCEANKIILKDGYWRLNENSDEILECDDFTSTKTCIENNPNSKQGCIKGYIGPLCQECDYEGKLWNIRYSQSSLNQSCQECTQAKLIYSLLFLFTILLIIYLTINIIMFAQNFSFHSTSTYLRYMKFLPLSASCVRDQSTYYIKTLTNYIQISSIIFQSSVESSNYATLTNVLSYFGIPSTQILSEIHCLYPDYYFSKYGVTQIKILIKSIYPILLLALIIFIFYVLRKLKKFEIKLHHNYAILTVIFFQFQPELITMLTSSLSCRKIGQNEYISINLLLSCSDTQYKLFTYIYSIPYLLIILLLPLFAFKKLYNNRNILDYCTTKYKFGYFYLDYKPNLFFWEFIRIYFKTLIAIIFILTLQYSNSLTYLAVCLILSLYLILNYIYQPYLQKKVLILDCTSILILIINIFLQQIRSINNTYEILVLAQMIHFFFITSVVLIIVRLKINNQRSRQFILVKKFFQKYLAKRMFDIIFNKEQDHQRSLKRWIKLKQNITFLIKQKADQMKFNCDFIISKQVSKTQSKNKNYLNINQIKYQFTQKQKVHRI